MSIQETVARLIAEANAAAQIERAAAVREQVARLLGK